MLRTSDRSRNGTHAARCVQPGRSRQGVRGTGSTRAALRSHREGVPDGRMLSLLKAQCAQGPIGSGRGFASATGKIAVRREVQGSRRYAGPRSAAAECRPGRSGHWRRGRAQRLLQRAYVFEVLRTPRCQSGIGLVAVVTAR